MEGSERADRELLDTLAVCGDLVPVGSVYRFLAEHRLELFPDGLFAGLFSGRGRRSQPASVIATVLVLVALEGLSDREAVGRLRFDVRWKAAAGLGLTDGGSITQCDWGDAAVNLTRLINLGVTHHTSHVCSHPQRAICPLAHLTPGG